MSENQQAPDGVSPLQPVVTKRLLDNLPGLIGGIDWAIRDKVTFDQQNREGKNPGLPFVLLVACNGGAAHAQNFDASAAASLVVSYAVTVAKEDAALMALLRAALGEI